MRHEVEKLAVEPIHEAELASAEPPRALGNHVEYRLDVTPRAADHLEYVGSGNLLLTRLFQFTGEPNVFIFLLRSGGKATTAHSLSGLSLALSRCNQFATCFGAPPHLPPPGQRLRC